MESVPQAGSTAHLAGCVPPGAGTIVESLCKLPLFRPLVLRVLKELDQEDADIAEVTRLIQADPALSAEILVLANSALFGFSSRIASVLHAVVILGQERTRAVTLAISMRALLKGTIDDSTVARCWRHGLACGCLAAELAAGGGLKDRAYTAGLIHDIGRLGLLASYRREYLPLLEETHANPQELLGAERRAFHMDHAQASMCLMRAWQFPQELCSAAERHHERPQSRLDQLVAAGCRFADALGFAAGQYQAAAGFDEVRAELPADIRALVPKDADRWADRVRSRIASFKIPISGSGRQETNS